MATVFPQIYQKLLEEHEASFVRLYGNGGYPIFEDVAQFEVDVNDNISHLKGCFAGDVSEQLGLWGNSKFILESALNKCDESASSEGLPTVSHVYLELVHSFVLLKDGLFSNAMEAVTRLANGGSSSSKKILSLFALKEEITHHKTGKTRSVRVVDNLRNALAHSRISLTTGSESMLVYDGSLPEEGDNRIGRQLQDVTLLGKLMCRFTISVVHASELIS
jgi:hypothetical protein